MRVRPGTSTFEYSLSRPFPSPVFTWIIVGGGLALAILFSFVAVASNAYELASIYTTDPNGTESGRRWFQKQPFSWLNDMETKCQPALLTVGTRYLTTSRGFVYTLDSLRKGDPSSSDHEVLSSTAYKNATLRDCEVSEIVINLARRDNSHQAKNFWAWGASNARATTSCTIESEADLVNANFAIELPPVAQARRITESFTRQNSTGGNLNMWYGVQIAMSWYQEISTGMGWSVPETEVGSSWGAGTVTLSRNVVEKDYKKLTFFNADVTISNDAGGLSFMHSIESQSHNNTIEDWAKGSERYKLPNISTSIDAFGKTFFSLLLSDFGAGNDSNALLTADGIQYLQSIVDNDLADATEGDNKGTITHYFNPNSADDTTTAFNTTTQATLFTQYLCSVPRSKGGVSIFFGVLLADIVFLSACYSFFVYITTTYVVPRLDARMNYCEGCVAGSSHGGQQQAGAADSQELLPVRSGYDRLSTISADPLIRQHSDAV